MALRITLLAAAAALSAGAAQAAVVDFEDAAVRVTVIPENRSDVKVEVIRQHPGLPLKIRTEGDRTIIDGGLEKRIRSCGDEGRSVRIRDLGTVEEDELPTLVIRTPRDVKVEGGGVVRGSIGRSASLDLQTSGCSSWTVADVAGVARVRGSGAGNVRMGQAERLEVRLSGAGHLHAVRARQGLDAHLSGAGGVKIKQVGGPIDARVSGVGRIEVDEGRATTMKAHISGLGQVEFGGAADSLDASISGFGKVDVANVRGPVRKHVSGGGRVTVGER